MTPYLAAILPHLLLSMGVATPPPATHPLMLRADEAAADVVAVVEAEPRIPVADRERWVRMVYVMHGKEAGFYASPMGSNDQGAACGALQVHAPFLPPGVTCADARASRRVGLRAGVLVALAWLDRCGTFGGAWSGFAAGTCPPKGYVLGVIKARCQIAGVSC